ncbi:MAG: pilin [Patescibacteria group bacterium]
MFISGFNETSNSNLKMQKSKCNFKIKKISLAAFLAVFLALSFMSSVRAADARVAGTVASSIDQKAIERAGVTVTRADTGPSRFFPKSTSTGEQGGFHFDIPETEFGGNNTLRILLTVTAPNPLTATATATFTAQKTGANNVPIIKLNIAGNTNYTPQSSTPSRSGIISYTSPDLSPIFRGKTYQTLGDYLTDLVKVAMVLSVVAATLVVVYAGFGYLNSGGSPEATAHAKEMIAGAIFGIATVFMMSAFLVSLYGPEALAPPAQPPSCPTVTSGLEGIAKKEGCQAANRSVHEIRARPRPETCDREIVRVLGLPNNSYDPATQQSRFNSFNEGFIEQCAILRA